MSGFSGADAWERPRTGHWPWATALAHPAARPGPKAVAGTGGLSLRLAAFTLPPRSPSPGNEPATPPPAGGPAGRERLALGSQGRKAREGGAPECWVPGAGATRTAARRSGAFRLKRARTGATRPRAGGKPRCQVRDSRQEPRGLGVLDPPPAGEDPPGPGRGEGPRSQRRSSPPSTARDRPRPEVPPGHAEFGARRNPRTRLAGPGPPPALRCQGNRPRREPRASTLRGSSSVAPPGQRLRPAGRGSGGAPRG